ncbi:MAG: glycosyl hydrolase [Bacteroidia bacterium]
MSYKRTVFFSVFLFSFFFIQESFAQLKFLIEDFEGCAEGHSDSDNKLNGFFAYGNVKASVVLQHSSPDYIGQRFLQLNKGTSAVFGGWGKAVGSYVELALQTDYLNFFFQSKANTIPVKIQIQEDDNGNGTFDKEFDDVWEFTDLIKSGTTDLPWTLESLALSAFTDNNPGGDGVFNVSYKQGKLLCLIFSFKDNSNHKEEIPVNCFIDFICFSKGKLPTGNPVVGLPDFSVNAHCSLGIWSKEGVTADFIDIANGFQKSFKNKSDKRLAVVHFFLPLAVDGSTSLNNFPEPSGINKIIKRGYLPMITLEDYFVNVRPRVKQPNLYSIVEGHFDSFFKQWAHEIKKVNGLVLLRLLHEFNGDWYPWCISKNNNDPELLAKAFRHIHTIFTEQQVNNVKYIWCPNSISFPQESWNFIMDAYPGDEYVDFVGLDIYNGAGQEMPVWRSFRKEGIENYFILTEKLPHKPLLVCEVASRERQKKEPAGSQSKAEWIEQMSIALQTDMSNVKLISWFNEKESFRINSSVESRDAYIKFILNNEYFKSGTGFIEALLK